MSTEREQDVYKRQALRCLLLPVLKEYRLRYPGIHIRISNHSTPQAISALKEGKADIAVVTTPTPQSPTLTETVVRPIREAAVCSPYFTGLCKGRVSLGDLEDYTLTVSYTHLDVYKRQR